MNNNDNNKYYLLNYTHEKIQALLQKIDEGWVLNEADYDQLINIIGLDNISTFSGWYDDLQGKPNLTLEVEEAVNAINATTIEAIRNFILEQDASIVNELNALEKEVTENRATKQELENGLKQKSDIYHNHDLDYAKKELEHDHNNKTVIDTITEANIQSWTATGLSLEAFKTEAFSKFALLLDVIDMLEGKADVVHFHDDKYAAKITEHMHANQNALDAVSELKINNWDANITKATELEGYINLIFNDIATLNSTLRSMQSNGATKAEVLAQLMEYAKLQEMKDHVAQELESYYDKTNMNQLLETKVDKQDGKGLSTNDLTDELHALLKEILDDADNTNKTVNEFVLDRIDKALIDPNSELAKALDKKVEKQLKDPADESKGYKGLSDNNFTDEQMALLQEILNAANDLDGDGVVSVLDYINKVIDDDIANNDVNDTNSLGNLFDKKVDKAFNDDGSEKVLSENDFADRYKALLDEILVASTDVADFIDKIIAQSIINDNNNDDAIFTIGEALLEKVNKAKFTTLEKANDGTITVVADDEANFDETTMIKETDAKLINPDYVIGDKLKEVEKEMGLSEVPFTEEQSNFLNQVMAQGATNEDKVNQIISDSIKAEVDDGFGNMIPAPGSINEALNERDNKLDELEELLANKIDKEENAILAENQDGSEGLLVVASGAVTDPDTQIAIDDPRLIGSGAIERDYVNIIQKGLSSNDYTDEDKQKLQNIELITKEQIDIAFNAAGFNI